MVFEWKLSCQLVTTFRSCFSFTNPNSSKIYFQMTRKFAEFVEFDIFDTQKWIGKHIGIKSDWMIFIVIQWQWWRTEDSNNKPLSLAIWSEYSTSNPKNDPMCIGDMDVAPNQQILLRWIHSSSLWFAVLYTIRTTPCTLHIHNQKNGWNIKRFKANQLNTTEKPFADDT